MDSKFVKGTPPPALLPAKNYVFRISDEHYVINIPRKGNYYELAPDIFSEDAGEFNIYDEDSKILYLPSITKVLFAVNKYPDLDFNQFFIPYSVKIEDEEVIIVGQVVDMILAKKEE